MKTFSKLLLGSLLLSGLQFALSGCASEGDVSGGVYYGRRHRDPWFHDDPWMDGRRWHRGDSRPSGDHVDVYISPPPSVRIRLP